MSPKTQKPGKGDEDEDLPASPRTPGGTRLGEKELDDQNLSWMQWISLLMEAVPQQKDLTRSVSLDLDTATVADLERSREIIDKRLAEREEKKDPVLLRKQLRHVEQQLDLNDQVLVSIPHLEIYKNFLGRVLPTDDLAELHASLVSRIEKLLNEHPNLCDPRSGDREGTSATGAYVHVPIKRRRQTAVVLVLNFFTGPILVTVSVFLLWLLLPAVLFYTLAIGYVSWVVYDNRTRPFHGLNSRMSEEYRSSVVFQHYTDYYPLRLCLADYDADKETFKEEEHRLFCLHPHGVHCCAVFSFISSWCGRNLYFPKLHITAQTLPINFWGPVLREHCIAVGAGNASVKAIKQALTYTEGASTVLAVGGAKEALYAMPHGNKLGLKNRYGFIKLAFVTGSSIVPCYSFGENSVYDNLAASRPRLLRWQRRLQRMLTFAPLLVAGRGVFSYSGGLMPHRRPVTTVVGTPIPVLKTECPTEDQVKEIHKKYVEAVRELTAQFRDIYDPKLEPMEVV